METELMIEREAQVQVLADGLAQFGCVLIPTRPDMKIPQQLETVAELVAGGLSNQEIAERLWIARATVERHIHRLGDALGIREEWKGQLRVEIVRWWYEHRRSQAAGHQQKPIEKKLYCDECGETWHTLVRETEMDEVWRCACGRERWFRVR